MEESQETWKGFTITRDGPFWKVKNIKGLFTTLEQARRSIDAKIVNDEAREYRLAIYRIRREPDLNKRTRMYKKLCQQTTKLS